MKTWVLDHMGSFSLGSKLTWWELTDSNELNDAATLFKAGYAANQGCELLGLFGLAVQLAITVVCAIALVAVWFMETPRRPFLSWAFDVSKQVVGAAYGKLWNIAQSIIFAQLLRGSSAYQDQCVWYLMMLVADCFFLTFLCWYACNYCRPILLGRYYIDIGDYDGPAAGGSRHSARLSGKGDLEASMDVHSSFAVQARAYCVQLAIWIGIITACRLVLSVALFFLQHQLYGFYAGVFEALNLNSPEEKLLFSVLIFPAFSDTFQIVVQDRFLKKQKSPEEAL